MEPAPIIIGKDYTRDPVREGSAVPGEPRRRRVVITGASGMLGSYLTAQLLESGFTDITLMVRSLASLDNIRRVWEAESFPYSVERLDIAKFDLSDQAATAEVFRGADTVFNCAATVAIGGMDRQQVIDTNVGITRTVSRAAIEAGVRLLVHVSSVAALTPTESGKVDSHSRPGCGEKATPYAHSKYLSELEIESAARLGLRYVTVNPVTILGYGEHSRGSSAIIPAIARGIPVFPRGTTGWVDARDAARAMVKLSSCGEAPGRRFVLCGTCCSFRELLSTGCAAAGKKPPRIPLPLPLARAASGTEKIYSRLTGRRRLLTPEMVTILYGRHYYDGDEIKKYINFDYSPLPATIERLVRIYRERGGTY